MIDFIEQQESNALKFMVTMQENILGRAAINKLQKLLINFLKENNSLYSTLESIQYEKVKYYLNGDFNDSYLEEKGLTNSTNDENHGKKKYSRVVISPFLFTCSSNPHKTLNQFDKEINTGNLVDIKEIELTSINSYPFSFALERTLELNISLQKMKSKPRLDTVRSIESVLVNKGYKILRSSYHSPSFVTSRFKTIPLLKFESIMYELIQLGMASIEELSALQSEIKAFISLDHTLISFPGIIEIQAIKIKK